jgi:hypothetical protein
MRRIKGEVDIEKKYKLKRIHRWHKNSSISEL